VTSTIVFDSDGQVREYVGGYEDWVRQRAAAMAPPPKPLKPDKSGSVKKADAAKSGPAKAGPKKLTYREQREFDELPARIEGLEAEQRDLAATLEDPGLYTKGAAAITASLARQATIADELAAMYARWDELDARATRSSSAPSSTSRSR